jgi:hypothetical protein
MTKVRKEKYKAWILKDKMLDEYIYLVDDLPGEAPPSIRTTPDALKATRYYSRSAAVRQTDPGKMFSIAGRWSGRNQQTLIIVSITVETKITL